MNGLADGEVGALVEGQLPWPRTRSIMSSYKDRDRFLSVIEHHQQRTGFRERILMPIGEHLFIVDKDGDWITKCDCGQEFGDYRQNWKLAAAMLVRRDEENLREIYPHSDLCDPGWMELREFICPNCAALLEVEACAPGYPIVQDFVPDIVGFYRDWLGMPLELPGDRAAVRN